VGSGDPYGGGGGEIEGEGAGDGLRARAPRGGGGGERLLDIDGGLVIGAEGRGVGTEGRGRFRRGVYLVGVGGTLGTRRKGDFLGEGGAGGAIRRGTGGRFSQSGPGLDGAGCRKLAVRGIRGVSGLTPYHSRKLHVAEAETTMGEPLAVAVAGERRVKPPTEVVTVSGVKGRPLEMGESGDWGEGKARKIFP